jgi:hypothetical protein
MSCTVSWREGGSGKSVTLGSEGLSGWRCLCFVFVLCWGRLVWCVLPALPHTYHWLCLLSVTLLCGVWPCNTRCSTASVQAYQTELQFLPLGSRLCFSVSVDLLRRGSSLCCAMLCSTQRHERSRDRLLAPILVQRHLSRRCYYISLASLGNSKSHVEWHAACHGLFAGFCCACCSTECIMLGHVTFFCRPFLAWRCIARHSIRSAGSA